MRTTVDIDDALHAEAQAAARRTRTSVSGIVNEALRKALRPPGPVERDSLTGLGVDANVLIALSVAGHEHHSRAREWLGASRRFATCPSTQVSLIRYLRALRAPTMRSRR